MLSIEGRDNLAMSPYSIIEMEYLVKEILKMKQKKNTKVLFLNCGTGVSIRHLGYNGIKDVVGVENNGDYYATAEERGFEVEHYDYSKLDFKDDSFDIVIGVHLLNKDGNSEDIINESLRIARKVCFIIKADSEGCYTREELSNLFRKIPDEKHKVKENIVKESDLVIFYRKK